MRRMLTAVAAAAFLAGPATAQQNNRQENSTQQKNAPQSQDIKQGKGDTQGKGWHWGWYHQSPWFGNPQIREQLKLNDEQFGRLNKVYGETWTRYNQGMSGLDKLEEAQRQARIGELSRQFETDFTRSTSEILNPQQQERFRQMWYQTYPYSAFNNPEVQQKLNLTDEQRQQIGKFSQQAQQQMSGIYKSMENDFDAASKQYGNLQKQTNEQINNVLNQQQQQAWRSMTGEPFNFTLPRTSKQ